MKRKKNVNSNNTKREFFLYFVGIFAFIMLYNILVVNRGQLWHVDDTCYSFHLVDFSFGFVTKVLPGAIYHLFFKDVYLPQVDAFETALLCVFFAFVSFCLAKMVHSQSDRSLKVKMTVLFVFYLTGPASFSIFTYQLGMLDVYWLFFAALFLCCVNHKYLKFALPSVFLLSLLVHFSSLVNYCIFYFLILFYEIVKTQGKEKKAYQAIFAVSALVCLVTFVYFLMFEKSNLVYTQQEFVQQLYARNKSVRTPYTVYYEYSLYKSYQGNNFLHDAANDNNTFLKDDGFISKAINLVLSSARFSLDYYQHDHRMIHRFIFLLMTVLPLFTYFVLYWCKRIKQSGKKSEKLLFALPIAQFIIGICIGSLFSADTARWFTHAMLCQFTFFIFVVYHDKDWASALPRLENKVTKVIFGALTAVYFIMYATVFVSPYA